MKGHKEHHHRKHKAEGGANTGVKEWEEDLKEKPTDYTAKNHVAEEAEEKKHGGRAKRKRGGHVHHEHKSNLKYAKHLGHIEGEAHKTHAGRRPRKAGGRAGSNFSPLSSAHAISGATVHKTESGID
jgi:hypothetical protein